MTLVVVIGVMLASFGAIAWPFFVRRPTDEAGPKAAPRWDGLVNQRDAAYQALKELEFEYNLGNLSDTDYGDLRERYRSQAAGILQRLDAETQRPDSGDTAASVSARPSRTACPFCSEAVESGDAYCGRCGNRLDQLCNDCGEPLLDDDQFCAGCGRNLRAQV